MEQESLQKTSPPQSYIETINGISFKMIYVEGGEFMMGDNQSKYEDEKPAHRVELDSFYMAEFQVTQELWQAVMGSYPPKLYNKGCDKCPVECVSWTEVQEFIQKLNEKTGRNYHLPSEAQWEFVARGGRYSKGYQYAGSNDIDEVAWYWQNSGNKRLSGEWAYDKIKANHCKTHPVGLLKHNELGLYDMSGNVWEWCEDAYEKYFYSKPEASLKNPVNRSTTTSLRVPRGGSYFYRTECCQVWFREDFVLKIRLNDLGFRLSL